MRLSRNTLVQLILLLSVTLLVTRIVGNHLHLCFDGAEPPVSMHTIDVDEHHSSDTTHDDQDVQLPSATIVKHSGHTDDPLLLFVLLACVLWVVTPQRAPIHRRSCVPRLDTSFVYLPPLRGPPSSLQH